MGFIKNLNYKIDQFSLNIPYLEIKEKKINIIMGPSGSGKSTLFSLISGYLQSEKWSCEIAGVDIVPLTISEKKLGIVFQSYELFPHLTAEENILLTMKSRDNFNTPAREQLEKLKNKLNLNTCWQTQAQLLSGGEQQRVALLRALMSKPRLLLLDEPFSALNKELRQEARVQLQELIKEYSLTTLLITHDDEDAAFFNERVVILNQGQIVSSV